MSKFTSLIAVAAIITAVTSPSPAPQGEALWETGTGLPIAYTLEVPLETIGPRLIEAGVIDPEPFIAASTGGRGLTASQQAILDGTSRGPLPIDAANAKFVLNFMWAVGLANNNPILTDGPMTANGAYDRYASTGGWTVGARPVTDLYATLPLVALTAGQQARLETVTKGVYRPCCNNSTYFPDCNHGMAMLGLLTLLAGQDASTGAMYEAALALSGLWFPAQAQVGAAYATHVDDANWAIGDPAVLLGLNRFSSSGMAAITAELATLGEHTPPSPGAGGGCTAG